MNSYQYLAEIYDAFLYDTDYAKWAAYLQTLLRDRGVHPGAQLLECACGTGNLTQYLCKKYDVIALDKMPQMLELARTKPMGNTCFVCADMAEFVRENKAQAVVCAMDGVNYLKDAKPFFRCAYQNLLPGGTLLFDISTAYKLQEVIGSEVFFEDADEATLLWTNACRNDCTIMNITLFLPQESGLYERRDEQHVQYIHTVQELKADLEACGFCEIHAYGFGTTDTPKKTEQRIQFCAKRG